MKKCYLFLGLLVISITSLGFWGLNRSNRRAILCYTILMAMILLCEASVGGLSYLYRGKISNELSEKLSVEFYQRYSIHNETTIAVDQLQTEYKHL